MREFGEQLMPKPTDNLDFSQKEERSHTIEAPHSTPIPVSLQDWLVRILRRLLPTKAPTNSEESENDSEKEK
jgi:hypothetical protein